MEILLKVSFFFFFFKHLNESAGILVSAGITLYR